MIVKEEQEEEEKSKLEYIKVVEKQEMDRANYFKNIEAKSTDFMAKMTEGVLRDLKNRNLASEKRMDDYLKEKDERTVQYEKDLVQKKKDDKKIMKMYLDEQLREKKKLSEFDKELDSQQAFIINNDYELYKEYLSEADRKVFFL